MIKKVFAALGITFALACGTSFMAPSAQATARFEAGDAGYVKADETVDGGAYMAGKSQRIEGTVNGDVFCAGEDVIISGTVNGDVVCAGVTVAINGTVTGDIRVAGSSVTISAQVGGNVTAFGDTITIETAATIAKDATIAGSTVLVNGAVGRDIVAGGSSVTLNGKVGRNVEGAYERLTIGKDATVGGFLHYTSANDAVVEGQVVGNVQRFEPQDYNGQYAGVRTAGLIIGLLLTVVSVVVTAVALMVILPKKMTTAVSLTGKGALFATLLGFFALFGVPALALFAMLTVVAIPLALALLFVWLALLFVSLGVTAIYVGRLMTKKRNFHPVLSALLGGVVVGALLIVPIISIFVGVFGVSFGLGAVLYAVRGEYEAGSPKPTAKLAKG